jgi:hypothetical protein
VLDAIATVTTRLFDLLLTPFGRHAGLALAAASVGCGAAVMAVLKATSDQALLRRVRQRFQARILEIRIYQDDPVLILRALAGALAANLVTLRLLLLPLVLSFAVVALVYLQLEGRFAVAPLRGGERTVLTATYGAGVDVMRDAPTLATSEAAAELEVRVPERREVTWRVRAGAGTPVVTLGVGDRAYRFPLTATPGTSVIGQGRSRSAWDAFLHPGLPRLPADVPIERVTVRYPAAEHVLLVWRTSWLWVFVFWSLAGAMVFKFVFRVAW